MQVEKFYYDNRIVKQFAFATILWGVVGMLAGLLIAVQIYLPAANFGLPFTTFGGKTCSHQRGYFRLRWKWNIYGRLLFIATFM